MKDVVIETAGDGVYVTIHPSEDAALDYAVDLALENTDYEADEIRENIRTTDVHAEGDYSVRVGSASTVVEFEPEEDEDDDSDEWFGLTKTGEWIEFVKNLGRILCRDRNAQGLDHMAYSGEVDTVAYGIIPFLKATQAQKEEAFSLVGKPLMEVEEHFINWRRNKNESEST